MKKHGRPSSRSSLSNPSCRRSKRHTSTRRPRSSGGITFLPTGASRQMRLYGARPRGKKRKRRRNTRRQCRSRSAAAIQRRQTARQTSRSSTPRRSKIMESTSSGSRSGHGQNAAGSIGWEGRGKRVRSSPKL
ncbi:hypothetical protein [Saltwater crocodilepox virus]|nr:hypothetical protein [Saltwater crocodilepox virus]QGT46459.1 ORF020 [Saltwater crocodilepox virus]QGT46675.1 ORF020 [Saltwater crocodilepox virus]QGT46892.1 ORF020 [Saltwater crocodilepox virus]QGT47538.1 ORF020 [Saltwater crocodilepox virus]